MPPDVPGPRNTDRQAPVTVRYKKLTERGVPSGGIGVTIRDYEGQPAAQEPIEGTVYTGMAAYGIRYRIEVVGMDTAGIVM